MLSWSTSGMGRENANQEFKEFKEFEEYQDVSRIVQEARRIRGEPHFPAGKDSSYSLNSLNPFEAFISKHLNIGACRLDRMGKR
jgi:hypothetical protein